MLNPLPRCLTLPIPSAVPVPLGKTRAKVSTFFLPASSKIPSNTDSTNPSWPNTVICDWFNPYNDVPKIESALARDLQLDFVPTMKAFAEGRAEGSFLLSFGDQVNRAVARKFIVVQGEKVFLNKLGRYVNTINTEEVSFSGWTSIKGLSFNKWNEGIFNHIGSQCGGLLDIGYSTKNFLELS